VRPPTAARRPGSASAADPPDAERAPAGGRPPTASVAAPPAIERGGSTLGGLALLLGVALLARLLGRLAPALPLAPLTLGLTLALAPWLRRWRAPGAADPPHDIPLSVGMILLGVQLDPTLLACLDASAPLLLALHWTTVALLFGAAARLAHLPRRTLHLVALGLSGCGLSAVMAAARADPSTRPAERDLAVAATLACGALGFVSLPLLAEALDLSPCALGAWAGLGMPTTAEAVLIGQAHGAQALTLVGAWRLIVNLLQAVPILLWIRAYATPAQAAPPRPLEVVLATARRVPAFVWGLALCGAFGFVGAFEPAERRVLANVTSWAFLMALVGVGLRLKPRDLLRLGWRPVLACVLAWCLAVALVGVLAWAGARTPPG
jgi:uncharacterized membrane protein YadS